MCYQIHYSLISLCHITIRSSKLLKYKNIENIFKINIIFSYIPGGYQYPNQMESNYGPVSMVQDENKLGGLSGQQTTIKEERIKENPSPHELGKHSQVKCLFKYFFWKIRFLT